MGDDLVEDCGCPSTEIYFYDMCPFLTCDAPVPHQHIECEKCGAVRHGNLFCKLCRAHRKINLQ